MLCHFVDNDLFLTLAILMDSFHLVMSANIVIFLKLVYNFFKINEPLGDAWPL